MFIDPSPKKLKNAIKSYDILMDTRFAMKGAFELFVNRYRSDLVHNPIKITSAVIDELQAPRKKKTQKWAERKLKRIKQYVAEKILEVRDDQVSQNAHKLTIAAIREIVSHEIFREVEMHIRTKAFIVLTFDTKLTEQLQSLVTHEIHNTKDLCIAKINSDGELQPNRTIAQHQEWRLNRSQRLAGSPFRNARKIVPDQGIIIPTQQVIQEGSELITQSGQNLTLRKELGKRGRGDYLCLG